VGGLEVSDDDLVLRSFERAAETGEDVTRRVHQSFLAADEQHAPLMDHMDEHMLGRMMEEVLTVLMAEEPASQRAYLHFEIDSHRAYGVLVSMYPDFLAAVRDTIRELLGDNWNPDYESAWNERISQVLAEINLAAQAAEASD
jgi:hemoglobin-like flavoprotein